MGVRDNFNEFADQVIAERRWSEARELLVKALAGMPPRWKPAQESGNFLKIAFWDEEEFFAYVQNRRSENERSILWTTPSYSKAWWQLAVVTAEEERFDNALICIESGVAIEPDHPRLWSERGFLLNRLRRPREALECYEQAAIVRDWAPASQVSLPLRGQGSALIDLGRLDDAENAYRRSLELEPNSELVQKELEYISGARQEQARQKKTIPWFLNSLLYPPIDPLTIQLLTLVEDLEPIPGPQTIGSENYSRVAEAFMSRGWVGFEEAFDSIVLCTRGDYADLKRALLREPIFNQKTHLNLLRMMLGQVTLEEVWEEISRIKESLKLQ